MTEQEKKDFFRLLQKFCEEGLDQWETWQVDTKHGHVFVDINRVAHPAYRYSRLEIGNEEEGTRPEKA